MVAAGEVDPVRRGPVDPIAVAGLVAIALGVVARVVVVATHKGFHTGDQYQYSQLALALADHLRYTIPLASDPYHWAPGSPLIFAVGLRIFGQGALAGAYVVQLAISIATLGLLYVVARRWVSRRAAILATAALALASGAIATTGDLITEPLGAFLLLATVGALAVAIADEPPRRPLVWAAVGGLALGAGVLTRPDYLVLVGVVLGVLALGWHAPLRRRLRTTAVTAVACVFVVAPYCAIATHKAHQLVLPTTSGGSSFFVGTYLPADGATYRARALLAPEVHALFPDTAMQSHPVGIDLVRAIAARRPTLSTNAAIAAEVSVNLRRYALGHPFAFARMQVRKVWRMWARPYAGHSRTRTWFDELLHLPSLFAAVFVLVAAAIRRRRDPVLLLIAALIVVGTLFNAFAAVQPRANARFLPIAFFGLALALAGPQRLRRPAGARVRACRPRLRTAALLAALGVVVVLVVAVDRGPIRDTTAIAESPVSRTLQIGPGIRPDHHHIVLGVLAPLHGPEAAWGRALTTGARAYFLARDRTGGIHGWRVKLAVQDSGNTAVGASRGFARLSTATAAIEQSFGLDATITILNRAHRLKMLVGVSGANESVLDTDAATMTLGAPYAIDAANAADAAAAHGERRIALVTAPGRIGREVEQGYEAAVRRGDVRVAALIDLRGDGAKAVAALAPSNAQAAIVSEPASGVVAFVRAARKHGYHGAFILTGQAARLPAPGLRAPLRGVLVTAHSAALDAPTPAMAVLRRDVRALAHGHAIVWDQAMVDGYVQAKVTAAVLARAIHDRNLAARGILDARLLLGRVDLGGLAPDPAFTPRLGPSTRQTSMLIVDPSATGGLRAARQGFFEGPVARTLPLNP